MVIKLLNERAGKMNSDDNAILKQFETKVIYIRCHPYIFLDLISNDPVKIYLS